MKYIIDTEKKTITVKHFNSPKDLFELGRNLPELFKDFEVIVDDTVMMYNTTVNSTVNSTWVTNEEMRFYNLTKDK